MNTSFKAAALHNELWMVDKSETQTTTIIIDRETAIKLAKHIMEAYSDERNQPE